MGRLKALIFDIDGTLYRQGPLRRAMFAQIIRLHAMHPLRGWRTVRILSAYRRAQEVLRTDQATVNVAAAQIRLTCERTNVDQRSVSECVERWMEQEPLAFLPRCAQPGVFEFLRACKARGLRLGALSDYPAEAKLQALGLGGLFDEVLCAQAPDVDAFKPNPRGLLVMLKRLESSPEESLYVGDRIDVDAATAEAARVPCAILTQRRPSDIAGASVRVSGFPQLQDLLWPPDLRFEA